MPKAPAPRCFYYAAIDATDGHGRTIRDVPVSRACLSARGAGRHCRRLQSRFPGVYVLEHRAVPNRLLRSVLPVTDLATLPWRAAERSAADPARTAQP